MGSIVVVLLIAVFAIHHEGHTTTPEPVPVVVEAEEYQLLTIKQHVNQAGADCVLGTVFVAGLHPAQVEDGLRFLSQDKAKNRIASCYYSTWEHVESGAIVAHFSATPPRDASELFR